MRSFLVWLTLFGFCGLALSEVMCLKKCKTIDDGCCTHDADGSCLKWGCPACHCDEELVDYKCVAHDIDQNHELLKHNCTVNYPMPDCDHCVPYADPYKLQRLKHEYETRQTADGIVIDFDDVPFYFNITGYRGLNWLLNNSLGYRNLQGYWRTPKDNRTANSSYSPPQHIVNCWGATRMGISFPQEVFVKGAYFAVEGSSINWAPFVKAEGWRNGSLVYLSDPIALYGQNPPIPRWLPMDFDKVDLVIIVSGSRRGRSGWYAMDHLIYVGPGFAPPSTTGHGNGKPLIPVSTGLGFLTPAPQMSTGGQFPPHLTPFKPGPSPTNWFPNGFGGGTLPPWAASPWIVSRNITHIQLKWYYLDSCISCIFSFEVQFMVQKLSSPGWQTFFETVGRTAHLDVTQPQAIYDFRVRARNNVGKSPWSHIVESIGVDADITLPPGNFTVPPTEAPAIGVTVTSTSSPTSSPTVNTGK